MALTLDSRISSVHSLVAAGDSVNRISFFESVQEVMMSLSMSDAECTALKAKRDYRKNIILEDSNNLNRFNGTWGWTPEKTYNEYEQGNFKNLDSIRLRWISSDYFEFLPRKANPFLFIRANGIEIEPRHMFTDGGSVPQIAQSFLGVSPWSYAPAFLVHDWLFDLHHCNKSQYDFATVRDILMEAIKTLMETGVCPKNDTAFFAIYAGVSSFVAKQIWNKVVSECPLPPDYEE